MEFDVAVLGLGAMGSAACATLAQRGLRVAGFDRYPLDHELGSSAGHTRIIRKAYFEHPSYVPLLERAYELWAQLEERSGMKLLDLFGVLMTGRASCATIRGVEASAQRYGIAIERFDAAGLRKRYPVLRTRGDDVGILEPHAGVVFPERGIAAHLALARESGALLQSNAHAVRLHRTSQGLELALDDGTRGHASRVVICAGAWTSAVLDDLALPLRVERNVQYWFKPREGACSPRDLPAYFVERDEWPAPGYGVPDLGGGVKFAFHGSGETVDPDRLDRTVSPAEIERARAALAEWIPDAAGSAVAVKACMYTMTPDGHFAIGTHPHDDRVIIACGFSGHGYKFAPVIGEIAADLATERTPPFELDFLRLDRFTAGR